MGAKEYWSGRRHGIYAAAVALGVAVASPVAAAELLELHKWYDPDRGDNATTTHPSWIGAPGATRTPNYTFSAVEGRVLAPTAPASPGMVPLHQWYS